MTAHTPGPWLLSERDQGVYIKVDQHRFAIATVYAPPMDEWQKEAGVRAANAALIAAAPELAEALQHMLDAYQVMSGIDREAAKERAQTALRKAGY